MSVMLRLFIIIASVALVYNVVKDLIRRKLTERQSLFWLFVALVMFGAGLVPGAAFMLADFFKVEYAPSIVFAIALVAALFGLYSCNRTNADLLRRVNELSIQISILNSDIKASEPHATSDRDRR